ncbi:MAG: two-component regulator propeller domain-containing protein [Prevotella sp.]|nr:two-component regulator propeller domain-containing protein [Prevotella sp.]
MNRIITTLFVLLSSLTIFADDDTERFNFHIGSENGLTSDIVMDIAFDGEGLAWVATYTGVNRIAGGHIINYRQQNSNIANNQIMKLCYNKKYNLMMMGTQANGLTYYNFKTRDFESYTEKDGLPDKHIMDVKCDRNGKTWILSKNGLISWFDYSTKKFGILNKNETQHPINLVSCINVDTRGCIYIGHHQTGLNVYNPRTKKKRHYLDNISISQIFFDHKGRCWLVTSKGLTLLNLKTGDAKTYTVNANHQNSEDNYIRYISETTDKSLVACTNDGLGYVDLKRNSIPTKDDLYFYKISSLFGGQLPIPKLALQDKYGNLWMAGREYGIDIIMYNSTPFHLLQPFANINLAGVYSLWAGKYDVWAGMQDLFGRIDQDNHLVETISILPHVKSPQERIIAIKRSKDGIMWLGTLQNGVLRYNTNNKTWLSQPEGLEQGQIRDFQPDKYGGMYVSTSTGLYYVKDNKSKNLNFIYKHCPPIAMKTVFIDKDDKLWVGTWGYGLLVFDKQHKLIFKKDLATGLASDVNQFYYDRDGYLWIATSNGLFCFDNIRNLKKMKHYISEDKERELNYKSVTMDKTGHIWLTTPSSILFMNRYGGKLEEYDYRNGSSFGVFHTGVAEATANGLVYFGSSKGAVYFNASEALTPQKLSPLHIMSIDEFVPDENGKYTIDAGHNTITVRFMLENIAQINNVVYQYYIEGMTDKWEDTPGHADITIENLAPGDYVIKVRAKAKSQSWDMAVVTSVNVHMKAHWYWSWWSKTIYMLLAFGLLAYAVREYNKYNKNKIAQLAEINTNKDRVRFFTGITHELYTPLTLINAPLEELKSARNMSVKEQKQLKMISDNVERLMNLIKQIRQYMRSDEPMNMSPQSLIAITEIITNKYRLKNNNPELRIISKYEDNLPNVNLNRSAITSVMDNLLSNAIKYTPKGTITVSVHREVDQLITSVQDTGYGIKEEAIPHLFNPYYQAESHDKEIVGGIGIGLYTAKRYINQHGGTISVTSVEGHGSTFTFSLPIWH